MVTDNVFDEIEKELSNFRLLNGKHHEGLQTILNKYQHLLSKYRTLQSDLEETKEAREKYKRLARGQVRNHLHTDSE
jgi:hypothetical protein